MTDELSDVQQDVENAKVFLTEVLDTTTDTMNAAEALGEELDDFAKTRKHMLTATGVGLDVYDIATADAPTRTAFAVVGEHAELPLQQRRHNHPFQV